MAGSLRSVTSQSARKKKRGETDESYAKRIARLEQKRSSQAKNRKPRVGDEMRPATKSELDAARQSVPPAAVERFLEDHNSDLAKAEAQIAALVKQLEKERDEKARLRARIASVDEVANVRKHVENLASASLASKTTDDAEIIDLSGQCGQFIADSEIIEVFDVGGHEPKTASTNELKTPESLDHSASQGHLESDPASPPSSPLKGVSVGRGGATHRAFSGSGVVGEKNHPSLETSITLAEASEMLLWVGWVERARREIPHQPLYARFGDRERRAWLDAVAGAAEFVGCDDLGRCCDSIPFAFELAWTLRYALDSLPAASPILDVCWRFMSSFMKPQPRARLGVLAGSETVGAVNRKFDQVRKELAVGTLVIDRSERP